MLQALAAARNQVADEIAKRRIARTKGTDTARFTHSKRTILYEADQIEDALEKLQNEACTPPSFREQTQYIWRCIEALPNPAQIEFAIQIRMRYLADEESQDFTYLQERQAMPQKKRCHNPKPIQVRVTAKEKRMLQDRAAQKGITLTGLVIECLTPKTLMECWLWAKANRTGDTREEKIHFRATAPLNQALHRTARTLGLRPSDIVRSILFDDRKEHAQTVEKYPFLNPSAYTLQG